MPEFVLGLEAKVYYRSAGSFGSPTWTEITSVKEITLNLEAGEFVGSTRGSVWEKTARTLLRASVDITLLHKPQNAGEEAIRDAFLNGTLIDMAIMNGAIATVGNEGLRGEMTVTKFSREEPLEEGLTIAATIKPGISSNNPYWLEVA